MFCLSVRLKDDCTRYLCFQLRVSLDSDEILINPFGLLYHEITASALVKVNLNGEIIDPGTTKMGINQAGYVLHSAIHQSRPEVRCIIHMHTAVVGAVSTLVIGGRRNNARAVFRCLR
jgi:adducin